MQIQNLNIERFGQKTNLILDGISDRLNVIYGPNGSGKSTTIQFIRWMLYGNNDEATRRYLSSYHGHLDGYGTVATPASGSMTFNSDGHRRTMARQDDGSRYGRVALDGDHRYARQSNHLVALLGNMSQHDFDVIYAPDFENEFGLSALLQSCLTNGIDLTSQRLPSERVQELRLRIDNYRRDMDRLPWSSGDLNSLLDRKRTIERRISSITDEQRRRRVDYDREYEEISRRIQDLELEVERLRTTWHSRDEEVSARRRELEEAYRSAEEAKREYLSGRRTELADLENHLSRARSMQSELQRRYDLLESQLRAEEINLDRTPKDLEESVCMVQSIARQLDEMKGLTLAEAEHPGMHRSAYRYRGSLPPSSASIDMLRHEVSQLCDTLQKERSDDRVKAMADELEQLRHTDSTMQRWIVGLANQRDQLARELDEAERNGVSLVVDPAHQLRPEQLGELELMDPLRAGRLRAVRHSCDGYEPLHPEEDSLLIQLTRQRDLAQSELQSAERQLTQLMERRRDLESALQRLTDRELEAAQRELAEIESLVRSAEERDRLQREIHQAEGEIARLRDVVRNSPVTEHATRILRRLTHGRYTNLRIDSTRNVSVEDSATTMVPVEHLSRGIRDQVYLSFCLAAITAHRRRGVRLPFILNDAFTNIDSDRDDTLAAVLREFAEMGQQVLVFTRHQHVAHLMRHVGARYLELGVVYTEPMPPVVESIDQVRFRPRTESESDFEYRKPATREEYPRTAAQRFVQRPTPGPVERVRYVEKVDDNDYREIDERPFEQIAQPIRQTATPARAEMGTLPEDFSLTLETPIDAAETVDANISSRLRAIGVVTVGDFLRMSPATVEDHLRDWGIESRPIRRWQDQLSLRCHVSGVGIDDARLLVACGVSSVEALAQMDVEDLNQRLQKMMSMQRTRSGSRYSSPRSSYHPRRLFHWVQSARSAASRRLGRRTRSELRPPYEVEFDPNHLYPDTRHTRPVEGRPDARYDRDGGEYGRAYRRAYDRDNSYENDGDLRASRVARSGQARSHANGDSRDNGDNRGRSSSSRSGGSRAGQPSRSSSGSQRRSRSSRSSRSNRSSNRSSNGELKFYLDRNDPVVDAPTIGPRTAERLHKVGIRTVDDLLRADAETLAAKLDYKRITADDVRQWQAQSILACRVPQLRGHDAQVLVAIGITDPDTLASMTPQALWAKVGPFVGTAECKKIIRNGKDPDLEEITDWIEWAQSARSLQLA